jgi:hypothetical protein
MRALLDPTCDVPGGLRVKITEKLESTGALRPLARSIKIALSAAIAELRGLRPDARSVLEMQRFSDVHQSELDALQAIYSYLRECKLYYTLGCLLEESGVPKTDTDIDIIDLLPPVVITPPRH